jgi:hypothetical protein
MSEYTDLVHKYFDMIASRHAMRIVKEADGITRYENGLASLQISYDSRRSYEVSVSIGSIPKPEGSYQPGFDLAEVLRSQNSPEAPSIECVRAENSSDLELALERFADLTRARAAMLLNGDPEEFACLERFRRSETADYAAGVKSRREIRQSIAVALENRDYDGALNLYRSLGPYLTTAERERMSVIECRIMEGPTE